MMEANEGHTDLSHVPHRAVCVSQVHDKRQTFGFPDESVKKTKCVQTHTMKEDRGVRNNRNERNGVGNSYH
jgi:hypothetical protein